MAQDLAQYISEQLKKGHSIDSIKKYLLRYGYSQQDVNDAINRVKEKSSGKPLGLSNNLIIGAILIILGIFGVIFAIILLTSSETQVIIQPSDPIQQETPIRETPSVIDTPVETTIEPETREPIIEENITETKEPEIKIEETKTCGICEDNNPCTVGQCIDGECIYIVKTPCCGNNVCEAGETPENCPVDCKVTTQSSYDKMSLNDLLLKVEQTAKNSASEATAICNQLATNLYKQSCFEKIALTLRQHSYCELIQDATRRDSCLINYAVQTNDFSICEILTYDYLKQNCITLRNMSS